MSSLENQNDDGRYLYATEEDMENETNRLFLSMGSGWGVGEISVPHILTQDELEIILTYQANNREGNFYV